MGRGPTTGLQGDGLPTPRRCEGDSPAVLALHGFGATPREVDIVIDVAEELGLEAFAPLLPGHGTNISDLDSTTFKNWFEASQRDLLALRSTHGRVIVCGMSLGALLGLHLADRNPETVQGLVLMSTPLWLNWPYPDLALRLHQRLGLPNINLRRAPPDLLEPAARRSQLRYGADSAKAAASIVQAADEIVPRLSAIACPALIVHGAHDRVVSPDCADALFNGLGTLNKRVVMLPRSAHIVTRDYDRDALRLDIRDHLRGLQTTAHDRPVPGSVAPVGA